MLRDLSIKVKLSLVLITGLLVLAISNAYISISSSTKAILDLQIKELQSINIAKKMELNKYFLDLEKFMITVAANKLTKDALIAFKDGFFNLKNELNLDTKQLKDALKKDYQENYLSKINQDIPGANPKRKIDAYLPQSDDALFAQYIFITQNSHKINHKNNMHYDPKFESTYMQAHKEFHTSFEQFCKSHELYDLFIADMDGNLIYTVFKEKDFATNLQNGAYKFTSIANLFQRALKAKNGKIIYEDFSPYEPSYNQFASFMATPIFIDGQKEGVLIFQMPTDEVDSIMHSHVDYATAGLGKSGEALLVGPDYMMRNNSRFIDQIKDENVRRLNSTIGIWEVYNKSAKMALQGKSGSTTLLNNDGKEVLSVYDSVDIFEQVKWAIITQIDKSEALAETYSLRKNIIIMSVIIVFVILLINFYIINKILINPLATFKDGLLQFFKAFENDTTDINPLVPNSNDELGIMTRVINTNISRLKQILEQSKSNERKYISILQNATDGVHVLDENNKVIECSNSFAQMLGYQKDEIIGKNVKYWDVGTIQKDSELPVRNEFITQSIFQTKHKRKDGSIIDVEINAKAIELDGKKYLYASSRDISNTVKLEEITKIQDMAMIVTWKYLFENQELIINDEFRKLYGISKNAEYGLEDLLHSVHKEDRHRLIELAKNVPQNPYEGEYDYRCFIHGKERYFKISWTLIKGIDEKVIGVKGYSQDLTQLSLQKKELETYRDTLEGMIDDQAHEIDTIFNYAPVPICYVEKDGQMSKRNKEFIELFKYDEKRVPDVNEWFLSAYPDEDYRKDVIQRWESYIKQAKIQNSDHIKPDTYKVMCGDGLQRDIIIGGAFHRGGFIATFVDISEQTKLYDELNESQIQLTHAQKIAKLGHWKLDFNSNFLYWNEGVFDIFELDKNSFKPDYEKFLEAVHPEDKKRVDESFRQSHKGSPSGHIEHRIVMKDGRVKFIEEHYLNFYDEKQNIQSSFGSVQDITHSVELRNSLIKAKQKAEISDQAKSTFLANMSHEIRTPLNGIIGLNNLLIDTDLDTKQKDFVTKIQKSSNSLLNIINDVLDLSKIEAGKFHILKKKFDLHDLIKDCENLYSNNALQKKITLHSHVNPEIPHVLIGDSLRISQVINNLLSNAIKFTHEGSINLGVDIVGKDEKSQEIDLLFSIKDSGIGISEEDQKRLFQAFEQGDSSHTKKYGGTGLGLMISQQLVGLMGSNISCQSAPNEGSTFSFILHLSYSNEEIVKKDQNKINTQVQLQSSKIALLAEDNTINQVVATNILQRYGFIVEIANDGKEAIEMSKEKSYDIIFMDLQMPNMDGFDATRAIRRFNTQIPIIALSAAVMEKDKELTKEAGMNDHLAKPIDIDVLNLLIEKYFDLKTLDDSIEGVALDEVLQNFENDTHRVYDMYERFSLDYSHIIEDIKKLHQGDSEKIFEYVDKLKDISSDLKIEKVFEISQKISHEKELKHLQKLAGEVRKVCKAIDKFLQKQKTT